MSELSPNGTLRVGVNLGNFLLVNMDAAGELHGIVPDLAQELGRRLEATVQLVPFPGAGETADGAKSGAWDVAFLGAEPQRAEQIAFTPAYLEIPATYLAPAGSKIHSLEEADKPGVRIAVSARSAYDLYLSRNLKHAQLERAEGIPASVALFASRKLEALAGLKPGLMAEAQKLPGSHVLDGQVTSVQQSIGAPKQRQAAARFLREFVEDIKRSGLVARTVDKHGVKGIVVAPPA